MTHIHPTNDDDEAEMGKKSGILLLRSFFANFPKWSSEGREKAPLVKVARMEDEKLFSCDKISVNTAKSERRGKR